jgi:hypothetical protein
MKNSWATEAIFILAITLGFSGCASENSKSFFYNVEDHCDEINLSAHNRLGRNRAEICRLKRERDAKKQETPSPVPTATN